MKEAIIKMKGQPIEWEKTFRNHTSDMGLVSKIYRDSDNSTKNKPNNVIKKMGRGENFWLGEHGDAGRVLHLEMAWKHHVLSPHLIL